MAYVTGTAASMTLLRQAIFDACTANGWTLAGSVLYKSGVYVQLSVFTSTSLRIQGGTGIDGSSNLTGAASHPAQLGDYDFTTSTMQSIVFPLTYEIHINTSPDEVYVIVKYATDYYQWMNFGKSDVAGLPGTGAWYAASGQKEWLSGNFSGAYYGRLNSSLTDTTLYFLFANYAITAMFNNGTNGGFPTGFIHHGLDSRGWTDSAADNFPVSGHAMKDLINAIPSAWNSEPVLVPFYVFVRRPSSSLLSLVADLKHIRHFRLKFHLPGDVITLGADKWKVYPWYKFNASGDFEGKGNTASSGVPDDSSNIGFAVRYTGP